jgi:SAM-dependent methyltransferase
MKTKKYQLHNSYFKVNKMYGLPETITEIAYYEKEHGELPFKYDGSNWVYDAFVERQKYRGVYNSQFLTPDQTCDTLMHFAGKYFHEKNNDVLEPFCGTGQITKELIKCGYSVEAFDNDDQMILFCDSFHNKDSGNVIFECCDFRDFDKPNKAGFYRKHHNQIVANPPYELPELTEFLEWTDEMQDCGGISVLLLPKGFIDKDKPKRTFQILSKFGLLEREDMREEFARTKTRAEIVVLKKI